MTQSNPVKEFTEKHPIISMELFSTINLDNCETL